MFFGIFYPATAVNKGFQDYVSSIKPKESVIALYNEILQDARMDSTRANRSSAAKLKEEISKLDDRIKIVYDKFLSGNRF